MILNILLLLVLLPYITCKRIYKYVMPQKWSSPCFKKKTLDLDIPSTLYLCISQTVYVCHALDFLISVYVYEATLITCFIAFHWDIRNCTSIWYVKFPKLYTRNIWKIWISSMSEYPDVIFPQHVFMLLNPWDEKSRLQVVGVILSLRWFREQQISPTFMHLGLQLLMSYSPWRVSKFLGYACIFCWGFGWRTSEWNDVMNALKRLC